MMVSHNTHLGSPEEKKQKNIDVIKNQYLILSVMQNFPLFHIRKVKKVVVSCQIWWVIMDKSDIIFPISQ